MKKRNEKCSEEVFWEVVDEIDWGRKSKTNRYYSKVIMAAAKSWSPEFQKSFDAIFREKQGELMRFIARYEKAYNISCEVGDDGFSDLTAHIVGCGKKIYEESCSEPKNAVDRAHEGDYIESFSYCIPSPPSWHGMSIEDATNKALQRIKEEKESYELDYKEEELILQAKREAMTKVYGEMAHAMPEWYSSHAEEILIFLSDDGVFGEFEKYKDVVDIFRHIKNAEYSEIPSDAVEIIEDFDDSRRRKASSIIDDANYMSAHGWWLRNIIGDLNKNILCDQ